MIANFSVISKPTYLEIIFLVFLSLFFDMAFSRTVGDDNRCKEIFEEYITQLKEEAKENERKRKEERV